MSAYPIQLTVKLTDVELMLGLKSGDHEFLEPILRRHRLPVTQFIYRHVHNAAIAEELAQEVFFSIYRARHRYEPSANFTTWLYRIAKNRAMNWVRDNRHTRNQSSLDLVVLKKAGPLSTPEQQLLRGAYLKGIRDAVDALPDRQRNAVLMHKFSGLGYAEIASIMECPVTTVKALINRAYSSLRKSLADGVHN